MFNFLNLPSSFNSWNDVSKGMLWAYNLNYMDWLLQHNLSFKEGEQWIDEFIEHLSCNKIGLDPYPIAIRGINWIKFILKYRFEISENKLSSWNNSLYSQYYHLSQKLEYHLLGNHLLEDAYSLYIASIYFEDVPFFKKSSRILIKELKEEILLDGAHFEQSPMYHCILLDRLLDCYNFSSNNIIFDEQKKINIILKEKSQMMLGHLESLLYHDGSFPLFNDSAIGIAPIPKQIFSYAQKLGLEWTPIGLKECGYRKMFSKYIECFVDVGNIAAFYQPGHSHADTFNYELRITGKPFIVDTGISTYNKTNRRQYERSTAAHNTVCVNGMNSSEVWGGFRIGKRANVVLLEDKENKIVAEHNGFGRRFIHKRMFSLMNDVFQITDSISTPSDSISYIHLDKNIDILSCTKSFIQTNLASLYIEGADKVEIEDGMSSDQYNVFYPIKVLKIYFSQKMTYKIKI